jgi:Tol biopolymer transport system component
MGSYTKYREAGAKWLIPIRYLLRIGYRFFKSSKSLQYVHKNGYYQYKDQLTKKSPLAHGQLSMDGHPTWYNNGQSLLVDTYQDEKNYRHLFSYDYAKQNITQLGKFYSPFNNCGYRCDLHPRIDDKGKFICIDSAHSGQRQLYVFKNK